MESMNIFALIIPYLVVELGMRIFAIVSILKAEQKGIRLRFDSMIAWILIVALVNFGWVFYFIFGKVDE